METDKCELQDESQGLKLIKMFVCFHSDPGLISYGNPMYLLH